MSRGDPGPPPEGRWGLPAPLGPEFDTITRHRLDMIGVASERLGRCDVRRRLDILYRSFLERIPFENLSNNRACLEAPEDPASWPRATDRFLRDNQRRGFGGTSFTLAYALRDMLRGVGSNAHCAMGRNLVTEEMHAVVLVYVGGETLLFDPALLACGPLPVHPGGVLEDPLGTLCFETHHGESLTLTLKAPGRLGLRPLYSIVPAPTPPRRFRHAWVASFCRGRCTPLRMARRVGDEIRRYSQRPGRFEILTSRGREVRPLGNAPVEALHKHFGIDEACLRLWFTHGEGTP